MRSLRKQSGKYHVAMVRGIARVSIDMQGVGQFSFPGIRIPYEQLSVQIKQNISGVLNSMKQHACLYAFDQKLFNAV